MAKASTKKPAAERPTLIDPADGPCPICTAHVSGQCDRCGSKKFFSEMNDHTKHLGGNGFQSCKPGHFHLVSVAGEDFNFCLKAREAGINVAVEPRIETIHYGVAGWLHQEVKSIAA